MYELEELRGWFGDDLDVVLERAAGLGLAVRLDEGVEVLAPSLLGALRDLVALGVPASAVFDVQKKLARATDEIAEVFADFVLHNVYREDADAPAHDLVEPASWSPGCDRWPSARPSRTSAAA